MAWTEYLVRPYVCMSVRALLRNLTVRILPNFACRISLWCRCAPSTFFLKISSPPVFMSIYSYFNTFYRKALLKDISKISTTNVGYFTT